MVDEDSHQILKQIIVGGEQKGAGTTGRLSYFHASTNVKLGGWYNAAKSYLDFGSAGTGEITGKASSFNAELRLPNKTTTGGMYCALEVNLGFQASTVLQTNPAYPTVLASFQVSGTSGQIDAWEANASAGVFHFGGLTAANDELFDASGGNAAYAAGLRIFVGSTPYWIMLTSDCSP